MSATADLGRPGPVPWVCPVCREDLQAAPGRFVCPRAHSFDEARQGYVNLLVATQRRSRQPGDSKEMVDARHRFLSSGAYDRVSDATAHLAQRATVAAAERGGGCPLVLDVGCGEGRHTRRVAAALETGDGTADPVAAVVAGVDVAKPAVALAARLHPAGWYAVASAGDLPLAPASIDVAIGVFAPMFGEELARVVRPSGTVIAVHPGPDHLATLRRLVYDEPRPHEVKDPLRDTPELFARVGTMTVTFPLVLTDAQRLGDLFAMTPYRWHAPAGIGERLASEARRPGGFETEVDVVLSTYRRTARTPL